MLGPVFTWELVRNGRRRWHWWARALYIGLLLLFLYLTFGELTPFVGRHASHQLLAEIGSRFYRAFSFFQLVAVLLLAPCYAVTSVSEEKLRQTLPYLLTSRLRDAEIVWSKIGLAVLRVLEVLLCGLPLCAICLMLGGVTPEAVFLDFLVALAAAWASCAVGVLMAVGVRRLVDALFRVFLVQMLWYILPPVDFITRMSGLGTYVPDALLAMNAFRALYRGQTMGLAGAIDDYIACLTATLLCAFVWSWLACWLLRPAWRREEERGGHVPFFLRKLRRQVPAKPVWDQPLLWRELRSRRWTSTERITAGLYLAVACGVLGSIAYYWRVSVGLMGPPTGAPPPSLLIAVFAMFLYLGFLAFPYLGVLGASAFAEEREGNQFDLLCITLLDQRDLVHAKVARLARSGVAMMMLAWLLQTAVLALGWSTWTGFVLMALHCLAAGAFWLMLGMAIGLRTARTSQAIMITLGIMLVAMLLTPMVTMMLSEYLFALALVSSPLHCMFLHMTDNRIDINMHLPGEMTVTGLRAVSLFYTLAHAVGAVLLYVSALQPAGPWRASQMRYWSPRPWPQPVTPPLHAPPTKAPASSS